MPAVPKIVHPIFLDESTKPLPIPAHTTSTGAKIIGVDSKRLRSFAASLVSFPTYFVLSIISG